MRTDAATCDHCKTGYRKTSTTACTGKVSDIYLLFAIRGSQFGHLEEPRQVKNNIMALCETIWRVELI